MPRSNSPAPHAFLLTPCCWRCASWGLCRKFEYRLACGMCFGQPPKPIWESWPYTCTRTPCHYVSPCVCVSVCVSCLLVVETVATTTITSRWRTTTTTTHARQSGNSVVVICTAPCIHLRPQANSLPPQHPLCTASPLAVRLAAPFVQIWSVACGADPSASCHCASVINFRTTPLSDSSPCSISKSMSFFCCCCCCYGFPLFVCLCWRRL